MALPGLLNSLYNKNQERDRRVESLGLSLNRYISENSSFDPETELYTNNSTSEGARNRLKLEGNRILKNHYGVDLNSLDRIEQMELYSEIIRPIWMPKYVDFENTPNLDTLHSLINASRKSAIESLSNMYYNEVAEDGSYHSNIEEHISTYTHPDTTLEEKINIMNSYNALDTLCLENGIDPTDEGRLDISIIR